MDKIITDWVGNPIGRESKDGDKTVVTTWTGEQLGTADDKGTRDFIGKPLSPQNAPDILLKKK